VNRNLTQQQSQLTFNYCLRSVSVF